MENINISPNGKTKEIILYIIFGVLTTLVNWVIYALLTNLCSLSILISNAISWGGAVAFAFVTNKIWVFESKSWNIRTIIQESIAFLASRAVTGVIEIFGVPLLSLTGFDNIFYGIAERIHLSSQLFFTKGIYSKAALAVIVIILNYALSKLLVFREQNKRENKN